MDRWTPDSWKFFCVKHVPEYENALEDSMGKGALKKFDKVAQENMSSMNFNAETLYNNFKKIL